MRELDGAIRDVGGTPLWVSDPGGDGPIVCFSHGLLWSADLFAPQIRALAARCRCVAWDHRGQGDSPVQPDRIASIEQCTSDAIALIEGLGEPVHFVGLSMGGFVGMRVAARRPELVRSLALLDTAADPEPEANVPKYRRLLLAARILGVPGFLADRVLPIMVARSVLDDPSRADDVRVLRAGLMRCRRSIHKAVNGVIEREACTHELAAIRCPTLVARGEEDVAIAEPRARALHAAIAGAEWASFPRAGHTAPLENPSAVTAVLTDFLERHGGLRPSHPGR